MSLPVANVRHPWGAALRMLVAVGCFALMDAGLKLLSARYPPFQVASLRGMASLPLVLAWALATVGPGRLLRVRWPLHLLRGALGVVMMVAFVYALRTLPLSTAYTLFFVAPMMITALSVPVAAGDLGLIAGVGVAGALGQYFVTEAFRLGEASSIAPLEYTALLWGVLLDFGLWHVLPDGVTWVGAGIIVTSGLYLLHRERVHLEAEHP